MNAANKKRMSGLQKTLVGSMAASLFFGVALFSWLCLNSFIIMHENIGMQGCMGTQSAAHNCPVKIVELFDKVIASPVSVPSNELVFLALFVALFSAGYSQINDRFIKNRYRAYIREHPTISLFQYLQEAFSQGILHSKRYA